MAHSHVVIDDDLYFTIDPSTREINNESQKVKLMQYDHNSEQFTFEIPRFVEGHDMSLCNSIRVNYININKLTREQNPGVYEVSDIKVEEDNIIFSWLVSRNATQYVGPLNFLIKFICFDEDDYITYEWHTDIFKSVSVYTGMNIEESIDEVYPDILEKWKNDVLAAEESRITAESERVTAESERAAAESERVTAESERAAAESERATAESERVTAESERVTAESKRVTAESERVAAESERVAAESERVTAESKRVTAETERVTAESERVTAESKRVTAESERAAAESERVAAESERVAAESERVTAESKRVNAESERATAETERVTAESKRVNAESERATAETERVTAESERAAAESERVAAESERVAAESERVTAESKRVTAETERVTAESKRATAESERATAETERATAETERANTFAGYETEITQLKDDITAITPDDTTVDGKPWTSKKIVDSLCQPFEESGNPVQCYPVENYPLGVKVSLEPVQEGSGDPSPDNIRPITGRDAVQVTRCGRNLFGGGIANVFIDISGAVIQLDGAVTTHKIPCKAGDEFILTCKNTFAPAPGNVGVIACYDASDALLDRVSKTSINKVTLTAHENASYVLASCYAPIEEDEIVFELGSTVTPYEPYTGNTYDIALPETVYGGELDLNTGVLTVTHAKTKFNPTHNINTQSSWTNCVSTYGFFNFLTPKGKNKREYLLDKLPVVNWDNKERTTPTAWYANASFGVIFPYETLGIDSTSTPAEIRAAAKAYLDELDASMVYELDTPYTIQLTQQQIAALSGVNTIYTDADGVIVTGAEDPKHTITELKNAIISLGGNI